MAGIVCGSCVAQTKSTFDTCRHPVHGAAYPIQGACTCPVGLALPYRMGAARPTGCSASFESSQRGPLHASLGGSGGGIHFVAPRLALPRPLGAKTWASRGPKKALLPWMRYICMGGRNSTWLTGAQLPNVATRCSGSRPRKRRWSVSPRWAGPSFGGVYIGGLLRAHASHLEGGAPDQQ